MGLKLSKENSVLSSSTVDIISVSFNFSLFGSLAILSDLKPTFLAKFKKVFNQIKIFYLFLLSFINLILL